MDASNPPRPDAEHESQRSTSWEQEEAYQTLSSGEHGLYPQFLLFGDSITQQSSSTLQARLQDLYIRRADVVNRGFSGYTTTLALSTLPRFLPPSIAGSSEIQSPIRISTIFFGANDACLPGNAQHVPLPLYTASLRKLAEYNVFKSHGTRIIFITPGPINEWQLNKPLTRTAANAKLYAEAVRTLAKEMEIPCVDIWTAFMRLAGYFPLTSDTPPPASYTRKPVSADSDTYGAPISVPVQRRQQTTDLEPLPGSLAAPPNKTLPTLLADGLHFTDRAYYVLLDELMATIRREIPECSPENLTTVFRGWRDILGVFPAPSQVLSSSEPELEHTEDTSPVLSETEIDGQATPESDWLDVQPEVKLGIENEGVALTGMDHEARKMTDTEVSVSISPDPVTETLQKHDDKVTDAVEDDENVTPQAANRAKAKVKHGNRVRVN